MDQNTNNAGMPQNSPSSSGPLTAVIVILAVLIVGGLYFWVERGGDVASDEAMESINAQSESDEIIDIEADLEATDVDNVDYDLNEENFNAS